MIIEKPTIGLVNVTLWRPQDGRFVTRRSLLGGTDVLGTAFTGVNVLPDAVQSVSIQRGFSRDGAKNTIQVGTMTVTVKDVLDPAQTWWLKTGLQIDVQDTNEWPMFSGKVSGISSDTQIIDGQTHTFTTITALDLVSDLSNVTRYGAAGLAYGGAFERPYDRLQRVLDSARAAGVRTPIADEPKSDIWYPLDADINTTIWPIDAATAASEKPNWTSTANGLINPIDSGSFPAVAMFTIDPTQGGASFTRTITGLTRGRLYRISIGWISAPPSSVTIDGTPYVNGQGFAARGDTATLTITIGATETIAFDGFNILSWTDEPSMLASTVYEGAVASHLDQIHASIPNGYWYIDAAGGLVSGDIYPDIDGLTLTDAAPPDPENGVAGYTALTRNFDTTAIINDLDVTSHRRAWTDGTGWADGSTTTSYRDDTSSASWGAASDSIDTQLASGITEARLAAGLLAQLGTPSTDIKTVTVNMQDGGRIDMERVEILAPITLTFNGTTASYRIANIQHTITGTRWMCTISLIKDLT